MEAKVSDISKVLSILAATPRQINNLFSKFDDDHLYNPPNQKAWSAAEILAHLRACADVWTYSIYVMLTEEHPTLPDINERKWAKVTGYAGLPIALALQAFTFQREELMRVLRNLPPEGWNRTAMIFEREHTVYGQARRMALHEQNHVEQMEQLVGK